MGTITKIRGNEPQTVAEWRDYISEPWQKAVESIIETGKRLIEAKESVDHGKWLKIFENNEPFGERTAERLMAIARHPVLSNPATWPVLPPSWRTSYELSQIPADLLLEMIQGGEVHSELTVREAEVLKGREDEIENLLDVLSRHCHTARELSLADCGGNTFDCSILKGNVPQELIDAVQEVINTWTKLRDHLLSLR